MRVGHSLDVHRFIKEGPLIIGGVTIDHPGLEGHSDADVLLHAIAESIAGALAIGDLGDMFPDSDDKYLNINSAYFVKNVMETLKVKGYIIQNIDCMLIAQTPNFKKYKKEIKSNVATLLETDINNVSIKATTTEKLGFIGNGEGIAATATVLIKEVL